ncbi:MAG: phage tail protein [Rickettsiales bacterium]|nr:phage tail protein [Rickettsiales bacterium]
MAREQVTEILYGAHNFYLEIESDEDDEKKIVAGFNAISGGGIKIEKRDVTHGDNRHKVHQPGNIEYENVTLSRGMTNNKDLLKWINKVIKGEDDRRSGSIILIDGQQEEVRRFNFFEAYPCSWSGPELSADSSAVALDKFELAVGWSEWE